MMHEARLVAGRDQPASHPRARAIVAVLLIYGLALSGCGTRGERTARPLDVALPPDTMTFDVPELGHYGGRFVIAETGGPRTFNAIMSNDQPTNDVTQRLFVGLTEFDLHTQQTVPSLAKSWEHSTDGRTWTFHLRRGA